MIQEYHKSPFNNELSRSEIVPDDKKCLKYVFNSFAAYWLWVFIYAEP